MVKREKKSGNRLDVKGEGGKKEGERSYTCTQMSSSEEICVKNSAVARKRTKRSQLQNNFFDFYLIKLYA